MQVKLCDPASGAFTHSLVGHQEAVWALHWSVSTEWHLVTGACDGQVGVALGAFSLMQTLSYVIASRLHLFLIACVPSCQVRLWDIRMSGCIYTFDQHDTHSSTRRGRTARYDDSALHDVAIVTLSALSQ